MENKQTAVEWLEKQIKDHTIIKPALINGFEILLVEAKAMEKEQIIKFAMHLHQVDMSKTGTDILMEEAEEYYNETYGKI